MLDSPPPPLPPAARCTGVVLAGGQSVRFGGAPKGLLRTGAHRVVDRVLFTLNAVCDSTLVVAKDPSVLRAALLGTRVERDVWPAHGSLVGLHAALAFADDAALVVAWDMPFVTSALLRALRDAGERGGTAAFPEGPNGVEPLCAYYPRRCIDVVEGRLARKDFRLSGLVDALPDRVVLSIREVEAYGDPARLFANLNTLADLALAAAWLDDDENRRASILASIAQPRERP